MRVLVTNGDTRPALAITRSLGNLGHEVVVAAERQPSLAAASRHCAARETYPAPDPPGNAFVESIATIVARRRIELLLPVTEIAATLLGEHRDRIPRECALPLPATTSLRIANDKARVLEMAKRLGVPVPETRLVATADQSARMAFRYPVVIKPSRSRVATASRWVSGGVEYAADEADLRLRLSRLPREHFPVLLQERIQGAGVGVFACYQQGRPCAWFSHRRLREKPPSGGVSVLCESVALDPVSVAHAERLLSALEWHGIAMVEFKRSDRDGELKLMEINGRFWGSLQLAIDAGLDFPALVARIAAGQSIDAQPAYRIGVRSRWLLGDVDRALAILTRSAGSLNLPAGHPGRLRSLAQVLNPFQSARGEVFRMDDRGPGWLELRQWLGGR